MTNQTEPQTTESAMPPTIGYPPLSMKARGSWLNYSYLSAGRRATTLGDFHIFSSEHLWKIRTHDIMFLGYNVFAFCSLLQTEKERRHAMYDAEKFKELVQYVCSICPNPDKLGAIKLNKILWYSELSAFLHLEKPITGARFVKRQFGPVATAMVPVLQELQRDGRLVVRNVEYFGQPKKEYISLDKADLSKFSSDEISIVDRLTETICEKYTAMGISRVSHDDIWEMAEIGEEIPLTTVFAVRGEVTEQDVAWADLEIKKLI
jgi:hypothetical protein